MSLVLRLTTPAGAEYDLALAANHRFGWISDDGVTLEQRVEQKLTQFAAGELEFTCHNDDGWWDTLFASLDHLARYPDTYVVKVERDGAVRWVGDIDPLTVAYDRIARTVTFTVVGKLGRLAQHSAEGVRRACPEDVDWGDSSTVAQTLTLGTNEDDSRVVVVDAAGEYAYVGLATTAGGGSPGGVAKVRLADMARVSALAFAAGETLVNAAVIDPAGEYLYVGCYTSPGLVVKVRLSDFTRVGAVSLGTGNDNITDLCISADGASLYASCYTVSGRVVKVTLATLAVAATCTLSAGENNATCVAVDPAGAYVYAGLYLTAGQVAKIQTSDMSRVSVLTLSAGDDAPQALVMDSGGTKLYVACETTPGRVAEVTLSSFTRTAAADAATGENSLLDLVVDADGTYLYASCGTSAARVVQFTRSALSRTEGLELSSGFNVAYGLAWDGATATLVLSAGTSAAKVARVATVGGLVQCAIVTDSSKAWTAGQFALHAYIGASARIEYASHVAATDVITVNGTHGWAVGQRVWLVGGTFGGLSQGTRYWVDTPSGTTLKLAATRGGAAIDLSSAAEAGTAALVGHVYTIVGNGATALVVAGTPAATAYTIRPTAFETYVTYGSLPRKMTSLAQTIAELEWQVGDKIIVTHTGGNPSRLVYSPKRGMYYVGTYEASQQSVAVKHVGPSTYPSLTAWEIGVDTDLTEDCELGDHVVCGTPYHRDQTVQQLVEALLQAGGLAASEYTVDLPTLTETVVEYADFEGKTVGQALAELAELVCCVVAATPTKVLFQQRETALGAASSLGALDLIASDLAEQPIDEESFDVVTAIGADDVSVTRGLVDFRSRSLEVSSDWLNTYPWLKQVCDRNAAVFLGRRRSVDTTILDGCDVQLVVDPSFEGDAAINASACQWKHNTAPGAGESLAKSGERAAHMRQSLKLVAAGSGAGMGVKQQLYGWTAGDTVRLSVAACIARTAGRLYVDLYGKDGGGTVVLDSSGLYYTADTAGEFVRKVETITIPGTCTQLWVRVFAGAGAYMTAYVDEVSVLHVGHKVAPQLLSGGTVGNEEYLVWACREPLISSVYPSMLELELRGTNVTAAASVYDTTSDEATPPTPDVESVAVDLYTPSPASTEYVASLSWPYPLAPVAMILCTTWLITADRPDTPTSTHLPYLADADSLEVLFAVSATVTANTRYVDFTILYADGRVSQPTTPSILPAST